MAAMTTTAPPVVDRAERRRTLARRRDTIISVASPFALLALWEVCAHLGVIDRRFFPPPSSIAMAGYRLALTGQLHDHILKSLTRLGIGFVMGGIPALIIGVAMGISRPLRALVEPLISATYPIPKSSILPLILLIFGLGEMSKYVMVAIGVFFPVAINATAGVLQISKVYLDVGKSYKANAWQTFWTVALPGALPFIMTGVKLGAGLGLVLIAVAEMIGAKSGLGYMIWSAWETFSVEQMYVGLAMFAVIGFILTVVLNEVERMLIPWKVEH
jgi:NitT/TauT family transport system permease protein